MGNSSSNTSTPKWEKLTILQLKKKHYIYIIIDKKSENANGEYLAYELVEDRLIPLIISSHEYFQDTGTLMLFTCLGTIKLPGQSHLYPQIDQSSVNYLPTVGLEKEIEEKIHNLALQQGIKIPIEEFNI